MSRIFSDDELELLATPLSIRLERAADARDTEAIAGICALMERECTAIYDKQCLWTSALQTFLLKRLGRDGHDDVLRAVAEASFAPSRADLLPLGFRDRVAAIARLLRASGSTFSVHEDNAGAQFRLEPSGSARLWRSRTQLRRANARIVYPGQGAYDDDSLALLDGAPCFFAVEHLLLDGLATITPPTQADGTAYLTVRRTERRASFTSPGELKLFATPLSIRVEALAAWGDWTALKKLSSQMDEELVAAKDPLNLLNAGLLTWIARELGETAAETALLEAAEVVMGPAIDAVAELPFADAFRQFTLVWRAHGSTFTIEETDEALVLRGAPMGACGRLWAPAAEQARVGENRVRYRTWGAYDPPLSFHVVSDARPMTAGETGMPIYSCHCHVFHEIFPIRRIGRPLWIEEHPVGDREGQTVHVHLKDPAAWPDHFFSRVGLERPAPK
jgi:hypothetical protein